MSHPFEQLMWTSRLKTFVFVVALFIPVHLKFAALRSELLQASSAAGSTLDYETFQMQGSSIGDAIQQWSGVRSTLLAAVAIDVPFAILYGLGLALLAGLIADGLCRCPRPMPLTSSFFSVVSWLFLLGGVFDVIENFLLLFAVLEFGSPNADVAWAGGAAEGLGWLKWAAIDLAVVAFVLGALAVAAAGGVAWYRKTQPRRGSSWAGLGFVNWAHQGGADERAANTMVAFERATSIEVPHGTTMAIELDVRLASDGTLVVRHDDELPGGVQRVSAIDAATLLTVDLGPAWLEQRSLTTTPPCACCGRSPHAIVTVPECRHVLAHQPSVPRTIEIKNSKGAPEALAALIATLPVEDQRRIIVTSMRPMMLYRFRRHDRTTATAGTVLGVVWFAARSTLRIPHTASHHAALQIPHRIFGRDVVSKRLIADAHRAGLVVHVWTVNDEADMRALLDRGVDGIMTDRPTVLAQVLRTRSNL